MFRVFPLLVAGSATLLIGFNSLTAPNSASVAVDTSNWGEADLVRPIEPQFAQEVELSNNEALVAVERSQMFTQYASEPALSNIDRVETGSLPKPDETNTNSELIKRIGVFLENLDADTAPHQAKKL